MIILIWGVFRSYSHTCEDFIQTSSRPGNGILSMSMLFLSVLNLPHSRKLIKVAPQSGNSQICFLSRQNFHCVRNTFRFVCIFVALLPTPEISEKVCMQITSKSRYFMYPYFRLQTILFLLHIAISPLIFSA